MKSVKGMTWGTPEFIYIAKHGEREGQASETIENLAEIDFSDLHKVNLGGNQREILRDARFEINEVLGEYACYGECEDFK